MAAGRPLALTPPAPRRGLHAVMDDGAVIELRVHGATDANRIVVSHGNGFAVDAYCPFWELLTESYEVVVFDLRNHGHNPLHDSAGHRLAQFVRDFEQLPGIIEAELGPRPTLCVFHSISAITSIKQVLDHGWRWSGIVAVDPPLIPAEGHRLREFAYGFETRLASWAAERRSCFSTPDELAEVLRNAKSRRRWIDGAHGLMARSVLRETGGEWCLACPGSYESQIYTDNAESDIWNDLGKLQGPILFVGADPQPEDAWSPALVNRAIHEDFGSRYVAIPDTSHMIHIEKPRELAAMVVDFARSLGV